MIFQHSVIADLNRNRIAAVPCHPELAAKSVETKSKRDFMLLPGVSGSLNYHK